MFRTWVGLHINPPSKGTRVKGLAVALNLNLPLSPVILIIFPQGANEISLGINGTQRYCRSFT